MITPKVLMAAINELIETTFPGIDVLAQEFEKGFKQPSFTVRFENVKIETIEASIETSLKVKTYYFPNFKDSDSSIDVLDKKFELAKMYGNKLYVKDRALNVIDPESDESNGVLIHEFDLLFEQYDETNDPEYEKSIMQELHITIEKEGN